MSTCHKSISWLSNCQPWCPLFPSSSLQAASRCWCGSRPRWQTGTTPSQKKVASSALRRMARHEWGVSEIELKIIFKKSSEPGTKKHAITEWIVPSTIYIWYENGWIPRSSLKNDLSQIRSAQNPVICAIKGQSVHHASEKIQATWLQTTCNNKYFYGLSTIMQISYKLYSILRPTHHIIMVGSHERMATCMCLESETTRPFQTSL